MLITISGAEGSGKSTLAKKLAKELGYPRIYVGGIRRKMAKDLGMTLAEFNALGEKDGTKTDIEIDQKIVQEAKQLGDAIVEGRVMYHFLPESIKIFLDVDLDEAAKRIFNDPNKKQRNEDEDMETLKGVKRSIIKRRNSDIKRYKNLYNIDVFDKNQYDLVIDTTHLTPQQTFKQALDFIKSQHNFKNKTP